MSNYFGYVGRLFSNVRGFYNEINAATLTGAIDSIIIQQEDGSFLSSPFHVRFGKLGVLRAKEKVVDIEINGQPVALHMKLGDSGEAFFVTEVEESSEEVPAYLATSPIGSGLDLMEEGIQEMKEKYLDENNAQSKISEVAINMEDPEGHRSEVREGHTKRRKRRRVPKKRLTTTGDSESVHKTPKNEMDNDIPMFDIDDVSSDEELANLPPMPPLGTLGKSVSLPIMEETSLQRTSDWARTQYSTYSCLHPFSDTDMSPMNSPASTRPPSPKSDTEVDRVRHGEADDMILSEEDNTLWEWGDLPRRSVDESETTPETPGNRTPRMAGRASNTAEAQTSGGLFQFMRKTKGVRHKPEEEGIYLDDLKLEEMDPEIAKLYFPKRFQQLPFVSIKDKEDDVESGRGASLPVSPNSVEGAVGGPSVSFLKSEVKHLGNFSMSLCGGLSEPDGVTLEKFMQNVVTFDDLCENCNMISNPELVIRINEKYYNWLTAAPIILSQVVFNKDLPELTTDKLCMEHMPKKKEKKQSSRVSSWFSWRRTNAPETVVGAKPDASEGTTEQLKSMSDSDLIISKMQVDISVSTSPHTSPPPSLTSSPRKTRHVTEESVKADDEHTSSDTDSDKGSAKVRKPPGRDLYRKTLRLSSDQIKLLNLSEGANEVTFSVTTQYQGTTKCTSHIFLWHHDDRIIISDIDGTITKSDVLGQILPIIGKDWSQSGVAQLYTNIQSNGYKFLYLSARAIGQSKITKDLLKSIKQDYHVLPEGPLLLSPTSLVSAFHREVIEKKPEDFKIACLKDIAELFPSKKPFYAGFGNKINDVYAYKAIKIPSIRIFTINHRGELKQESAYTFQSTYLNLSDVADHFFPPVQRQPAPMFAEYSTVTYWRDPLPEIEPIHVSKPIEPEPKQETR